MPTVDLRSILREYSYFICTYKYEHARNIPLGKAVIFTLSNAGPPIALILPPSQ